MSVVSFSFFVFLAVCLVLYYLVRPLSSRWIVLLTASGVFFVLSCGWRLSLMFAAQTLLAWGGTLLLPKCKRKDLLTAGIIIAEIAALIIMKESSFFTINARIVSRAFDIRREIPDLRWAAPLGMSYYTLMLVSYVLDTAWGKAEPRKNPFKLMLYAGFFPQMVSGPFTRYGEINAELYDGHRFDGRQFCFGAQRFLWGLFKKLVLAERLAVIVATIYDGALNDAHTFVGAYILIGAFAYVSQLYTDFSGCMDIVIGAAQMFGVKLPENFRTPFCSVSLSEFWRRWHMTLGLWLKDYVMYPTQKALASRFGQRAKKLFGKKWGKDSILYLSMLATWFCIGFWHGGSWKYICSSGLFFFVMIVGGLILEPAFKRLTEALRVDTEAWSWLLFQRLRTAALFTLSVSFGRASSLSGGFKFWRRAFAYNPWVFFDGSLYKLGLDRLDFWALIFGLFLLFVVSSFQGKGSVREKIEQQNLVFRWALWLGLFAAVLLFGMYGEGYNPSDFIYGGF